MASFRIYLCIILSVANIVFCLSSTTYLTNDDREHMKLVLDATLTSDDLALVHYAAEGYNELGLKLSKPTDNCKLAQTKLDSSNVESIYHAVLLSKLTGNCQLANNLQQILTDSITEEASTQNLYYAVTALKKLNAPVDAAKVTKALIAALKKDDGALSLGYAFHVASQLAFENALPFYDRVEDAVVQADEIDGKLLQFEGGLSASAIIISGIYRLSEHTKKPPPIDADKCVKFSNYFLSRKRVTIIRGIYLLMDVLNIFSNNKFHIPVAITLASGNVLSGNNGEVTIKVTNLVGNALTPATVTLDSAKRLDDNTTPISKKAIEPVSGDKTLYKINFLQFKPPSGFYDVIVSATPTQKDSRWVGNVGASVSVKVVREVSLHNMEVGIVDADQATALKSMKLEYPKKLDKPLEADNHQKIHMKFSLKDKASGATILAHQVFVQLTNGKTGQEITFVAEPDNSQQYKFELDIQSKNQDFGSMSGRYALSLIVGDAILSNPFLWQIGEIDLTFQDSTAHTGAEQSEYSVKPEIEHIFRQPEKRPPSLVSSTFTVLCAFPFLLLIVLWMKLGVNFSNFSFSIGTIGFHVGLGAIFALFAIFWIQLNMFVTLKYLALIGVITLLCGNSMLSHIAAMRKR